MSWKKPIKGVASLVVVLGTLVGCGQEEVKKAPEEYVSASRDTGSVKPTSVGEYMGLKVSLSEVSGQDGELKYMFIIKNDSTKTRVLDYSSSKLYDYTVRDNKSKKVFTFSSGKKFSDTPTKKKLVAGHFYEIELNLSKDLNKLTPGDYTIEAWSSASDMKELFAKAEFTLGSDEIADNAKSDKEVEKGKTISEFELITTQLELVGLQDSHSIEAIDEDGNVQTFQLSNGVKDVFMSLDSGAKVKVKYTYDGETKMIQSVES